MTRAGRPTRPLRRVVTLGMDLLVVVAAVVVAHLLMTFFGQIASQRWAGAILGVTRRLVIPAGLPSIETPYRGSFGLDPVLTVFVLLLGEWFLGQVRRKV